MNTAVAREIQSMTRHGLHVLEQTWTVMEACTEVFLLGEHEVADAVVLSARDWEEIEGELSAGRTH